MSITGEDEWEENERRKKKVVLGTDLTGKMADQPSIEYSQDLGHVDRIFAVGEKIRLRPNPNKINVFTQDMEQSLIKDVKRYDE